MSGPYQDPGVNAMANAEWDEHFQDKDKRKEIAATFTREEAINAYNDKMEKGSKIELSKLFFRNSKEDVKLKEWFDNQMKLTEKVSGKKYEDMKEIEGKELLVNEVVIASLGGNYLLKDSNDADRMKKDWIIKNIKDMRKSFSENQPTQSNKHNL